MGIGLGGLSALVVLGDWLIYKGSHISSFDCNVVLQSSKHKEMFFLYESIFVFIPYLIGLTLLKKCCLNWEYRKRYKMGGRGGGWGLAMQGDCLQNSLVQTFKPAHKAFSENLWSDTEKSVSLVNKIIFYHLKWMCCNIDER